MSGEQEHRQPDSDGDGRFWEALETIVDRLEDAWGLGEEYDLSELLAEVPNDCRRRIVVEVVKLDQEWRWAQRDRLLLEDYIRRWPELREDLDGLSDLVQSECEIRLAYGDELTLDEIESRFPEVCERIDIRSWLTKEDSRDTELRHPESAWMLQSIETQQAARSEAGTSLVLPRGYQLGRYEVLSVLGRGGMGIVYLAQDTELDRLVAVKLLHPWVIGIGADEPLLLKEARTAAKLSHASILPVYDFGIADDGAHFVVMEYIDGTSLDQLINSKSLTVEQSIEIAAQVADALDFAHNAGFVHRDIKPANILITSSGNVRIADFGLAVGHQDQGQHGVSGTIPYMPPEQLTDDEVKSDCRTDIWSLGVVLYEMLVGQRPFQGETIEDLSDAIRSTEPLAPSQHAPKVVAELDAICAKCLRKAPQERFSTANELATALWSVRRPRANWRRRLGATSVVVVLIVGLVFSITYFGGSDKYFPGQVCPWLKQDCKLVLNLQTGTTVDIDQAKQDVAFYSHLTNWLQRNPDFAKVRMLVVDVAPESASKPLAHLEGPNWICWEMPVIVKYSCENTKGVLKNGDERFDLNFPDESTSLKLRFAVSRHGDFQVGTISTRNIDQEHLLALTQIYEGVPNYFGANWDSDAENFTAATYLSTDSYDIPHGPMLTVDEKQTFLAEIAVGVYHSFLTSKYISDKSVAPKTNAEIHAKAKFEQKNYFGVPLTVVAGALSHKTFRDIRKTQLPEQHEARLMVAETQNDRWSPSNHQINPRDFNDGNASTGTWNWDPIEDREREYARMRVTTKFDLPEDVDSVLCFKVSSDNRNSARVSFGGLNRLIGEGDVSRAAYEGPFNEASVRVFRTEREVVLTNLNIASIDGALYDRSFEQIEMGGLLFWSNLTVQYRYAVLGDLDNGAIGETTSGADVYQVEQFTELKPEEQNARLRPTWSPETRTPKRSIGPRPVAPHVWRIPPSL